MHVQDIAISPKISQPCLKITSHDQVGWLAVISFSVCSSFDKQEKFIV